MVAPPENRWLIYGATGFTGKLIAQEAAGRGLRPVIAGRNPSAVEALSAELELEARTFGIDSVASVAANLEGIDLVLNCAGPYAPMGDTVVRACISRGAHYLDICGEPEVLEQYLAHRDEAAASGSVIVPAVGYDVVPSDTLAKSLAERMPDAVDLQLAFFGNGEGSAGSAKTVMGMMSDKCKVRRNGKIEKVPLAYRRQLVHFSDRDEWCMSIPWGDVCTAFHSTGIPNITVYMAASRRAAFVLRLASPLAPLLGRPAIRNKLFGKLEDSVQGPDIETRQASFMRLWGRVSNAAGDSIEATMDVSEGFTFTTHASLLCVERVLSGAVEPGCYTPTQAFGTGLAFEVPGTVIHW